MNITDLKAQYEILKSQLSAVNTQITNLINTKNKSYTYSNVESNHSATIQSLPELMNIKKSIVEQMTSIENQLTGCFVKVKNY